MNQEDIKDKIKKAAASEEIPQSLAPENIKEELGRKTPASPGFRPFRLAGGLAAILAVAVALGGIAHVLRDNGTDAATEMVEESASTAAYEGDSASKHLPDEDALSRLDSIGDYQELYEALEEFGSPMDFIVYDQENLATGSNSDETESAAADTGASSATTVATAAADESSHSTTNLRVEGVDEGDIVKTDGKYIYILSDTQGLRIVDAVSMEVVVTQPLESHEETACEMYLDKNTLLIVTTGTSTELISSDDDTYRIDRKSVV